MTFDSLVTTDMGDQVCDLRFVGVTKHYKGFSLQDVTVGVPRGSVVGLVGRNGAGKTTLMKAAFGIVRLDGGHVDLFGTDTSHLGDAELLELRRRVGFVGAVMAYPANMPLLDVAHLYGLSYPDFDLDAFKELCLRLGLDAERHVVKDLSRGMGMKLQIACVLASGADLLVLDEPTAGLDPIVRDEALEVLRLWVAQEGKSLLISSHITSDLDRLANYLVMVEEGRLVLSCTRAHIDEMGVARLRPDEVDPVLTGGVLPAGELRLLQRGPTYDLLVPDRARFVGAYPQLACDAVSIDEVVALVARGEVR